MDHLESGKINGRELAVYTALHMWADFSCGFVWKVSAPFLAKFLSEKEHITKKCLKSLDKKGYIKRFNHRGQRTYYPTLINNYEVQKGVFTRVDKTVSIDNLCLRVDFKCTLNVLQTDFKCPLSELYVSPIKEVKNIRIEELKNKRAKKPKVEKHKYGEYKNVLLTDVEKQKLKDKFGESGAKEWVVKLDEGIEQRGYSYNSHYLTILDWDRGNKKKSEPKLGI